MGRQRGHHWPAFIVRKEAKAHGTSRFIEGIENLKKNARLLVLEDVSTTGNSSLDAAQRLKEAGFIPVGICTVVDRQEGAEANVVAAGHRYFGVVKLSEIRSSR